MIRPPNEGIEVWLCVEPVDFRKQIPGLAALVQDTLAMDPFSAHLFVFTNRRRTQCRIEPPRESRRLHSLSLREEKADDFTDEILSGSPGAGSAAGVGASG